MKDDFKTFPMFYGQESWPLENVVAAVSLQCDKGSKFSGYSTTSAIV